MLPEIKYNQTISAVEWGIQKFFFFIFPCSVLYEKFSVNFTTQKLFLLEGGGCRGLFYTCITYYSTYNTILINVNRSVTSGLINSNVLITMMWEITSG